jgi:hypothetical protein
VRNKRIGGENDDQRIGKQEIVHGKIIQFFPQFFKDCSCWTPNPGLSIVQIRQKQQPF